jgi:hypothetical protein
MRALSRSLNSLSCCFELGLFLRGVGYCETSGVAPSSGSARARVPERLPPLFSPQLRRYRELHILLFLGLRHALSRDSDLRGTAEAIGLRGARQGEACERCMMHPGAVAGLFRPKIKFIGLPTVHRLGIEAFGRVRYHV